MARMNSNITEGRATPSIDHAQMLELSELLSQPLQVSGMSEQASLAFHAHIAGETLPQTVPVGGGSGAKTPEELAAENGGGCGVHCEHELPQ